MRPSVGKGLTPDCCSCLSGPWFCNHFLGLRNRTTGPGPEKTDSISDLSAKKPIINELLVTRALTLTNVKMTHTKKEI